MRMHSRIFLAAMLLASASTLAADAPQDAKVDRLADALVQMLPMGQIFQDASAGDPNWPMQGKPDAVSAEQLACLRGELSVAGFKRIRLADARKYAAENPSRLDEDLKLLEGGQIRRLLFAATGALMSPTASMQGESIPGICHAVAIETQVNT